MQKALTWGDLRAILREEKPSYGPPLTLKQTPANVPICLWMYVCTREGHGTPLQSSCLENPMDGGAWWATVHGVAKSRTQLSDFTFTFHFHALEKEMATHSSVLAWRIPGTGETGGLPSMGSLRVRHNWSDLAAAVHMYIYTYKHTLSSTLEKIQSKEGQNLLCDMDGMSTTS